MVDTTPAVRGIRSAMHALRSAPVLRMYYRLLLEFANGYWSELAFPFLDALQEDPNAQRGAAFKGRIAGGSRSVRERNRIRWSMACLAVQPVRAIKYIAANELLLLAPLRQ